MNPQLETRQFEVRKVNPEARTITGIAVPWERDTEIWPGFTERFQRGSVDDAGALLFYGHAEPIGILTEARDTDEGREITARISETARGDEVYTLAKDGVLSKLSIGFEPITHIVDEANGSIVRTSVRVREVSIVPFPAYEDASLTSVRSKPNQGKESNMDTATKTDLLEVRTMVENLDRRIDVMPQAPEAPRIDTRSAGEVLKAIVDGDQATIDTYTRMHEQRAFADDNMVLADAVVKPGWVGDLTRIFDASTGLLARVFATGTLPDSGMSIEYAQLKSNTIDVTKQAAEGNPITSGKVSIETKTANVETYAGSFGLSRQVIERSTVGVLNRSLEALAMAAGRRKKTVLRGAYDAAVAARVALAADAGVIRLGDVATAKKVTTATAGDWEDTLIAAALKFENEDLPMEALIVNAMVFKALRGLVVSGERVFQTYKDNASGELNLPGLSGQFAGLPVFLDSGQANTAGFAAFVNGRAIRQYDSPLVSLSDESIVTLSKTFAVYRYGAVANEIPAGIVPVKITAE